MHATLHLEPLAETFGVALPRAENPALLDLDRDGLIELFRAHGAVYFQGFETDLETFEAFSNRFCDDWRTYRGGAYGKRILNPSTGNDVFAVNVYGKDGRQIPFALPLHADMGYFRDKPTFLFLYLVRPARVGGETLLCDGCEVYRELSPATRRLFEETRIKYVRDYPDGNWQVRFQTDDVAEAHAFCDAHDLRLLENGDGSLTTEWLASAFQTTRWSGERTFCNSVLTFLWLERLGRGSRVRLEDDAPLPNDVVAELNDVTERLSVPLALRAGDVVWVDNTRMLHGRRAFRDPARHLAQRLGGRVDW